MKKVILPAIGIIIGTLVLNSCNKEYSCACTLYFENGATMQSTYNVRGKSKANALQECNAVEQTEVNNQVESVKNYACTIK